VGENFFTDYFDSLEDRRKAKALAYYERKKTATRQLAEAKKTAGTKTETTQALAAYGY
jgi:large subunit ribosomal protein L13Ae